LPNPWADYCEAGSQLRNNTIIGILSNLATAFGLSGAAGVNAYLPLLVVALTARFSSLITLNEPFNALESWWVIGLLAVLLIIETIADKIPAVDSVNDIIQGILRPVAGAILFAAASGAVGHVHPVVAIAAGLLTAGSVHAVKASARPVVTASTGGTGNWLVSILEDIWSFITSVMAILIPLVAIIFVAAGIAVLVFIWRRRSGQYDKKSPRQL
jgi:cbb3-type cytochrome oxidase maturation protein